MTAGWVGLGDRGAPSVSAQTGLAFLDGHPYWTRSVQRSFAVVDTGAVPGVRVYRENQLVGTTNGDGRLLVPDLLPFSPNHLSIDDRDLPIDLGLSSAAEEIAPPDHAGVPVHFGIDSAVAQQLRLIDATGTAVPAGASLSLDGKPLPLPVGYDGLVYADIDDGAHRLEVRWPQGQCQASLSMTAGRAVLQPCAALDP